MKVQHLCAGGGGGVERRMRDPLGFFGEGDL